MLRHCFARVPGASAGINIAQRLGMNPHIIEAARAQLSTQTQDIATFLDHLHADLRAAEDERARLRLREGEVDRERKRLETEGMKEQRAKMEGGGASKFRGPCTRGSGRAAIDERAPRCLIRDLALAFRATTCCRNGKVYRGTTRPGR